LIVATTAAILFLPIQQGVGIGIVLSLVHGVWTTTRSQIVELARISGTSIWWPKTGAKGGETVAGTIVVAWQAPLSFLNVYDFQRAVLALVGVRAPVRLVVIEANSLVDIDYTAAQVLGAVIRRLRKQGIDAAFARLESVRAQQAFVRLGLEKLIGPDHIFESVEEALWALAPHDAAERRGPVTPPSLSGVTVGGVRPPGA
jgi:SulP family sulfate permease